MDDNDKVRMELNLHRDGPWLDFWDAEGRRVALLSGVKGVEILLLQSPGKGSTALHPGGSLSVKDGNGIERFLLVVGEKSTSMMVIDPSGREPRGLISP